MSVHAKPKRDFRRTQGAQAAPKRDENKGPNHWKRTFVDSQSSNAQSDGTDGISEDLKEGELCIICADHMKYAALSPCHHVTCNKCTFRQRALYGKKTCLVCRTDVKLVVFTADTAANFDDFSPSNYVEVNESYGVAFTSSDVSSATLRLLEFICPYGDSGDLDYGSFKKFNAHLKSAHNKTICMICAQHKKAFPSELKIYTPNQLRAHQSKGDFEGFQGHPMCGFCSGQRFYSDDELAVHMRDRHERCHICDQIDSKHPQFFKDYDQLFQHFKHEHFICTVQSCLDSKFVVFRDDLDLQAHILREHGSILGSARGGISVSGGRRFQSQLSTFMPSSRGIGNENQFDSSAARESNSTNSDNSREVKKLRMEERARHYLNYSHSDFDSFLSINEGYQKRMITAEDVFHAYQDLFKSEEADIVLLIYDFSEMFPENSAAYKDLRVIYEREQKKKDLQTNFPSLSRSNSSLLAGNVIGGSWGSSSSSKPTGKYNFPALKKPTNSQPIFGANNKLSYKPLHTTASPRPVVKKTVPTGAANYKPTYLEKNRAASPSIPKEKFPPLPKVQTKKYRAPPLQQPNIPDPSQWSKSSLDSESESGDLHSNNSSSSLSSGGKKKGKQKQLLFHIGI
ncbi:LAFE_0D08174g1_1 [Lachancea fermentati]|uniref:LAFE_0D08174g1_1 n=1 Tax=Lachancea fermentati TaxID=4955 RepID=A0A1G4MBF8_LACFM|nr:LAFE_0D08174g1_1 [Lachancea fermentati]